MVVKGTGSHQTGNTTRPEPTETRTKINKSKLKINNRSGSASGLKQRPRGMTHGSPNTRQRLLCGESDRIRHMTG
jgi:hypothetical protein